MAGMTTSGTISPAVPGARKRGMGMPRYAGGTTDTTPPTQSSVDALRTAAQKLPMPQLLASPPQIFASPGPPPVAPDWVNNLAGAGAGAFQRAGSALSQGNLPAAAGAGVAGALVAPLSIAATTGRQIGGGLRNFLQGPGSQFIGGFTGQAPVPAVAPASAPTAPLNALTAPASSYPAGGGMLYATDATHYTDGSGRTFAHLPNSPASPTQVATLPAAVPARLPAPAAWSDITRGMPAGTQSAPGPAGGIDVINGGGFGVTTHQGGGGAAVLNRNDVRDLLGTMQPRIAPQEQAQHEVVSAYQGMLQSGMAQAQKHYQDSVLAAGGDPTKLKAAADQLQATQSGLMTQHIQNMISPFLQQLQLIENLQKNQGGMTPP